MVTLGNVVNRSVVRAGTTQQAPLLFQNELLLTHGCATDGALGRCRREERKYMKLTTQMS